MQSPSPFLLLANWKATKTLAESLDWWDKFKAKKFETKNIQVVLCPPAPYLLPLADLLKQAKFPFAFTMGAQDVSAFPGGAYTGEITARMLKSLISHVIVGHHERREYLRETAQVIARKTREALDQHIIPIVSVDQESFRNQASQLDSQELEHIVIMIEPPEAISRLEGSIGKGESTDPEKLEDLITSIKKLAPGTPILYGGSIKSANVSTYRKLPEIKGFVIGSASMDPDEFTNIINQI